MTALAIPRPVERFVDIQTSRTVLNAINMAVRTSAPVRIVGPSGTGKTAALTHHAMEFRAVYCECTGFQKNIKGMFVMLTAAYQLQNNARHTAEIADILYECLRHDAHQPPKSPLFVDEWQTLEPPAQRELLRLTETCAIPLVLSANADSLFSGRRHRAELEQINSRIAAEFQTSHLSDQDALSISADWNVEGSNAWELVRHLCKRISFRELNRLLMLAADFRPEGRGSIRLEQLESAIFSTSSNADRATELLAYKSKEATPDE